MPSPIPRSVEFRAVAVAAIGSISVGFVPFFVTGLQRAGVDTVSSLLWRYIVALAILVPLCMWRHSIGDEWRRGGKWLVLIGTTLGTVQVFLYFKSLETIPTSVAVTIFYFYPVLALAIDRLLFGITVTPATVLAVAVIIVGVALTSLPDLLGAVLDARGMVFALLSACGYAIYIAAAYPLTRQVSPIASAMFLYASFGAVFGAIALVKGFVLPPSPDLWWNVLFIGTLGGALQILSFSYALPRLASSGYSVIVCLEVVTVVLVGVVLLNEALQPVQWFGVVLVLAGIVLARSRRR